MYLPGDIVLKEGDSPSSFFFILSGEFQVISQFEDFLYFDKEESDMFFDPLGSNKMK
jgi:CRP-like cAMP-binding protein